MAAEETQEPSGGPDKLVERLAVLFLMGGPLVPDPETPKRILTLFDALDDFSFTGREILASERILLFKEKAEKFLLPGDRIGKKGRTLELVPETPRRVAPGTRGITLSLKGPVTLAFTRPGAGGLAPEVEARLEKAVQALPPQAAAAGETGLLSVAVLPQRKKLLSVETPLQVEFMGLPFSLRFLIARFIEGKVRLFAAGPMVKEIPLGRG